MPNDVYMRTHAALSALVSPRVAANVLEHALSSAGQSPDSVTTATMRHLLAGAVRKGLSGTFPRAALTHHLRQLADELAAAASTAAGQPTPVANALIAEADAERALKTLTSERLAAVELSVHPGHAEPPVQQAEAELSTDPGPTPPAPVVVAAGPLATAPSATFAPEPGAPRLGGRALVAPPPRERRAKRPPPAVKEPRKVAGLDEAAMEAALKLFGDIEAVRQIVVVRRTTVVLQRGDGVDAARLPGLVLSSRRLLARSSDLRALSVERSGGVLFLFPFGEDCVVVVTHPNVNIGAVLNARAALEEAA